MFGFVVPMGTRRGLATVRTRSGYVVNQWVVSFAMWAMLLGPAVLATWWAHRLGINSPEIWLAAPVALWSLATLAMFLWLAIACVSALRQMRGHEPREPWLSFSYDDDGADHVPWEIPKLW